MHRESKVFRLKRHGGLMVSALDSRASSPGSSPGGDIVLCSSARHPFIHLAPVVQRLDNAIHRINHYPADKC